MFDNKQIQLLTEENKRLQVEIVKLQGIISAQELTIKDFRENIQQLRQQPINSLEAGYKSQTTDDVFSGIAAVCDVKFMSGRFMTEIPLGMGNIPV